MSKKTKHVGARVTHEMKSRMVALAGALEDRDESWVIVKCLEIGLPVLEARASELQDSAAPITTPARPPKGPVSYRRRRAKR